MATLSFISSLSAVKANIKSRSKRGESNIGHMLRKRGLKNERRQNKKGNSKNPRELIFLLNHKSDSRDIFQRQAKSTGTISLVGKSDNKKFGYKESNSKTIIPGVPYGSISERS